VLAKKHFLEKSVNKKHKNSKKIKKKVYFLPMLFFKKHFANTFSVKSPWAFNGKKFIRFEL